MMETRVLVGTATTGKYLIISSTGNYEDFHISIGYNDETSRLVDGIELINAIQRAMLPKNED